MRKHDTTASSHFLSRAYEEKERKESMDYLKQYADLRRTDSDPELFAIALAIRHIRRLINYGGSDIGRQDDDLALNPHHLEVFINRAVEMTWKNRYLAQEWCRLQQMLPPVKEAWERGQTLVQEAFIRAKSDKKDMEYFSIIDFAFDCYAAVAASRNYPDQPALRNWAINGYMLAWREHFLKDQAGEERTEGSL